MSLALNLHFARQFFNDCIFHSQHYSVCLKYFRNDFLSVMILSMWQNRVFIVKSCNKSDKISSERSLNHGITCSHANAGAGLRARTNVFCSVSFRNPNPCLLRSELNPVSDAIISTTGMKLHITCIFYM